MKLGVVSKNFGINNSVDTRCIKQNPIQCNSVAEQKNLFAPKELRSYINFHGNAPQITKATIVSTGDEDVVVQKTENGGYVVEPETQTELIYGNDAKKFLSKTKKFEYDTQITFPVKAKGSLFIDGKEIKVKENSTVLLNKGTEAQVKVESGYPQILMSKKDYPWYSKHGNKNEKVDLKNKFNELIYLNSHTYNGEFRPKLFGKQDHENDYLAAKLRDNGFIKDTKDGFIKFEHYPTWDYQKEQLSKKGFNDWDLNAIEPVYKQVRQTKLDAKVTLRTKTHGISQSTLQKLKDADIVFNNKKQTEDMFWKKNYESEWELRDLLNQKTDIRDKEQDTVVNAWKYENKAGYDVTGLKFINNNAAVYSFEDKVNNWNQEKSCWLTNSTALGSLKGAPSLGTSIVQADRKEPTPMSALRKGEHLHTHPGTKEKSQTEIYMITSGSAALTVVRNGKPTIKVLREGELAIIPPKTPHCVNSVMGEYEQVVSQIPSCFQYGFGFKENMDLPSGYSEEQLTQQAREELLKSE